VAPPSQRAIVRVFAPYFSLLSTTHIINSHMRPSPTASALIAAACLAIGSTPNPNPARSFQAHLGFDRNDYPGDSNLKLLRRTFSYSGYWLNTPPGAKSNSWTGKRKLLQSEGFGFLVIFNGRIYSEIKAGGDAARLGASDAAAAIAAAKNEGFPLHTIIFLDQEEGGRLLPEQRAYLHAWVDGVTAAHFSAGVYCSGIAAKERSGASIVTAEDIRENAGERKLSYWVVNDACPPSPGCDVSHKNLSVQSSGVSFADVWQFAQSPRRARFAGGCAATYNKDGDCVLPSVDPALHLDLDLDVATSNDPSQGVERAPAP